MSVDGRTRTRQRILRRAAIVAAVLAVLALLLFAGGHWILGLIVGAAAAVAIWVFLQARTVR
jgi:uncharacterized membrane protein YgaE (UPF0421/DUF939 family)